MSRSACSACGSTGVWMHVGTPDAVQAAEEAFLESVA
jgi:hypothetical protein